MAKKEDIKQRMHKLNPIAQAITDDLDKQLRRSGYKGAIITIGSDMSPEEEEMALFEGFLREGYPEDMAARKAKEWVSLSRAI